MQLQIYPAIRQNIICYNNVVKRIGKKHRLLGYVLEHKPDILNVICFNLKYEYYGEVWGWFNICTHLGDDVKLFTIRLIFFKHTIDV